MSLSAEQLKARDGKLTASRVGVLMSGNPEKVMALWEEMTGQRESEDLTDVWPVQLGTITEALNLHWYALKTGRDITREGEVVICPRADWAACTLDGFDAEIKAVIEAKHVGGFEPREKIIERYQPQLHWQMLCCGVRKAMLSIIEGAREPAIEPIEFNDAYAAELWTRAEQFMACVNDLVPPVEFTPVAAPTPIEKWRTLDMTGNNAWASLATDWLANFTPAKQFEKCAKEIKSLVEADVGTATGHGISVKRNKAGSLAITAAKG